MLGMPSICVSNEVFIRDSTATPPPLFKAVTPKRKHVGLFFCSCLHVSTFSEQAMPSPAFRNSQLGWLRAAAGSFKGKDVPAFSMGMSEVS